MTDHSSPPSGPTGPTGPTGPEEARSDAPRARTRSIIILAILVLTLFAIILVVGVMARVRTNRELGKAVSALQVAPPGVVVIKPGPAEDDDLTVAGTTQAFQDAVIYARTTGYIKTRHADIGDRVRAGQLLAEIASPEIDRQLEQGVADHQTAQKVLDQQQTNHDLAVITMGRYQAADTENAVAKELVDQAVSATQAAKAAVAAAEATVASNAANVRRLRELTSFERIVAPFEGTVIQRNVDVGTLITAGSPTDNTAVAPSTVNGSPSGLFEVAQIDRLRVFVNVPQLYASNIRVGLPVSVTLRGQPMSPATGTVTRTANALNPGTRTLLTEVDVPNLAHHLLPGMYVYVSFKIATVGVRWRLPATAVIIDTHGTRVAVVGAGNKLRFQRVVIGRDLGGSLDVLGGLHGEEQIVKQPTVSLQEGQVVRPVGFNPTGT